MTMQSKKLIIIIIIKKKIVKVGDDNDKNKHTKHYLSHLQCNCPWNLSTFFTFLLFSKEI